MSEPLLLFFKDYFGLLTRCCHCRPRNFFYYFLSSCPTTTTQQRLLIQIVIQLVFAIFIYRFIVQQRGTTMAFLLGYGVVLPLAVLYIPFELLEHLDIQNRAIKMGAGTCAIVVGFRVVEAMHGTSPTKVVVESSLGTYLVYYSSLMHFEWNRSTGKRARITVAEFAHAVMRVALHYLALSLQLSFLMSYNYRPFPSTVHLDEWHFNADLMLHPGHLANMYCLAVLTYLVLAFGFELTALADQAQGYRTKPIFLNPLWTSPTRINQPCCRFSIHLIGYHSYCTTLRCPSSSCVCSSCLAAFMNFAAL
jgi:hypothetical protein